MCWAVSLAPVKLVAGGQSLAAPVLGDGQARQRVAGVSREAVARPALVGIDLLPFDGAQRSGGDLLHDLERNSVVVTRVMIVIVAGRLLVRRIPHELFVQPLEPVELFRRHEHPRAVKLVLLVHVAGERFRRAVETAELRFEFFEDAVKFGVGIGFKLRYCSSSKNKMGARATVAATPSG